MKSLNGAAVVAAWSALAAGGAAHAQEAVQWRVEDGGNGHWYVAANCAGTWLDGRDLASDLGGYLATLVNQSEHDFVTSHVPLIEGYWIGGFQDMSSPDYSEPAGGWRWVSGETFDWAAWGAGQPDNYAGDQRYLRLLYDKVDDLGESQGCGSLVLRLLIEWSADCNGDGIVDYGQILDGTFADINANGVPDTCECFADVNQDGEVNGADISAVLGFWGQAGKPLPAADITRDGLVDGADIAVLLGSWGPCQ